MKNVRKSTHVRADCLNPGRLLESAIGNYSDCMKKDTLSLMGKRVEFSNFLLSLASQRTDSAGGRVEGAR